MSLSVVEWRVPAASESGAAAAAEAKAVAEAGGDCVVVKLRQTYLTFYYGDRETAKAQARARAQWCTEETRQCLYRKYAYHRICVYFISSLYSRITKSQRAYTALLTSSRFFAALAPLCSPRVWDFAHSPWG